MALKERISWLRALVFLCVTAGLLLSSRVDWRPVRHAFSGKKSASAEWSIAKDKDSTAGWCRLPDAAETPQDGLQDSRELFDNEDALTLQVKRLSAAVESPTVSYDDSGDVDIDPRWRVFEEFHAVLEHLFPAVYVEDPTAVGYHVDLVNRHSHMRLDKVNTYGLLFHLAGSDRTLKPILLMAHQDTVPSMDASQWTHPPFRADFDGQFLWGRGSADCKSNLVGILSAMEALLAQDFRPNRSIIFSFGFDEETGGENGGAHLAAHLEAALGADSLAMVLDEGGMGISVLGDVAYALPAVAEKGFVDIVLTLSTGGGHSSRPPKHTAIGIMSDIILALEDHPFVPRLDKTNPVRGVLKCEAEFSSRHVEPWLSKELRSGKDIGPQIAQSRGDRIRWQIQTSMATTIVRGGEKDNQLPSSVEVVINYRILPGDDVDDLFAGVAKRVAMVAHEHAVAVSGLGFDEKKSAVGLLHLESQDLLLPSLITSTDETSYVWNTFSGTLRQVFESASASPQIQTVIPVGSISTSNTDTTHYRNLTENIFRFTPAREGSRVNTHDIDERMEMSAHMESVRVYYDLIRNFQERGEETCEGGCPWFAA